MSRLAQLLLDENGATDIDFIEYGLIALGIALAIRFSEEIVSLLQAVSHYVR